MRLILLFLLCGVSIFSSSQIGYTEAQINRLAEAGKLYGYIKYFHPYLHQYKNINWDSAFAAAVPGIIAAKNKNEYATVLNNLLTVLQDPVTTVIDDNGQSKTEFEDIRHYITDSILYVDLSNYYALKMDWFTGDEGAVKSLKYALKEAEKYKGVVFDLRPAKGRKVTYVENIENFLLSGGITELYSGTFNAPSHRTLVHKTKFLKYFQQEKIFSYRGNAKKEIPLVFIFNKAAQLPALVIALQTNGKAAIIQEESAGDISGGEYRFYMADSVLVRMRRSDLVYSNGSKGFTPTLTYSPSDSASLFNTAKRLINEGFVYTAGPVTPPLLPVPNSDKYASAYAKLGAFPSIGYRVIAAAEIYTVIDHFFAYKHLMDKNWEEAYREVLPKFLQAKDSLEYLKAVAELNYHINDGHGFVGHPLYPSVINGGTYSTGIFGKMLEGQFVVNVIANDSVAQKAGVKRGDIILEIRGRKPIDLINEVRKFKAASNAASQTYLLCEALLRGDEGEKIAIKVKDAGGKVKSIELTASKALERKEWSAKMNERLNEPTLRFVTKDIGYADLNKLQRTEIDSMFEMFRNTKAIIFDMRGYPNGVLWYLAGRLTDKKNVAGAIFKTPVNLSPNLNAVNEDLADRQAWVTEKQMIPSVTKWIYKGKTVMLMDESSLSQAEHTGLFLKAANGTKFIGSATAGANGTAFNYPIPGGIWMGYTGHQASHADGKQMQRIGLKPDVVSYPTIKGIQAGKDEVLERAVKYLQTAK